MAKTSTPTDKIMNFSLYGYDVSTAIPENDTVMSGFDYPKVQEDKEKYFETIRSTSFPTGTTNLYTLNLDDLGYKHAFECYVDTGPFLAYPGENSYGMLPINGYGWSIKAWTSPTRFKIDFQNDTGASLSLGTVTFKFKYRIWVNDVSGI